MSTHARRRIKCTCSVCVCAFGHAAHMRINNSQKVVGCVHFMCGWRAPKRDNVSYCRVRTYAHTNTQRLVHSKASSHSKHCPSGGQRGKLKNIAHTCAYMLYQTEEVQCGRADWTLYEEFVATRQARTHRKYCIVVSRSSCRWRDVANKASWPDTYRCALGMLNAELGLCCYCTTAYAFCIDSNKRVKAGGVCACVCMWMYIFNACPVAHFSHPVLQCTRMPLRFGYGSV